MSHTHRHGDAHHHHHENHHHHQHTGGDKEADQEFTEKNRKYFDDLASRYTEHQWQRDFVQNIHTFLLSHISWLGVPFNDPSATFENPSQSPKRNQVRVLDYACGPGTITNILDNHATEYVGIDLSENMVKTYNERFSQTGGESTSDSSQKFTARAVVGNLLDSSPSPQLENPEFFNFDIALVGAGFHHFSDVQLATNKLVERLKPGTGILVIIDFLKWESEEKREYISHHGFTEERVRELFGNAGLVDVDLVVDEKEWMMKEDAIRGFMAKGRRPAT